MLVVVCSFSCGETCRFALDRLAQRFGCSAVRLCGSALLFGRLPCDCSVVRLSVVRCSVFFDRVLCHHSFCYQSFRYQSFYISFFRLFFHLLPFLPPFFTVRFYRPFLPPSLLFFPACSLCLLQIVVPFVRLISMFDLNVMVGERWVVSRWCRV